MESRQQQRGRVVVRRLNGTEYENTVRDLLGTRVALKDLLPGDSSVAGFDIVPWPVDYRTSGPAEALEGFSSIVAGLERVDFAFREWVGLVAYRLSGRTSVIWPG